MDELAWHAPVDVDATKPAIDKKQYRLVRLECGMRVLCIHDPAAVGGGGGGEGEEDEEDDDDEEEDEEEDEPEHEYEHHGRPKAGHFSKHRHGAHDDGSDELEEDDECEDSGGSRSEDGGSGRSGGGAGGSTNAVVAVAVGVGSLQDPPDVQGLAHFAEHMCFMGSSAFPGENELDGFVAARGGGVNAYTELDHTVREGGWRRRAGGR